jgi:hypothetical protein
MIYMEETNLAAGKRDESFRWKRDLPEMEKRPTIQ